MSIDDVSLDDVMRPAARRLQEDVARGIDVEERCREITTSAAGGSAAPRHRRPTIAVVAFGITILVVVVAVIVAALARNDDDTPVTNGSLLDPAGLVVTDVPAGLHVTEALTPTPTPPGQQQSGCCASRTVVYATRHADGTLGSPVLVRVIRNPLNGVLADQDPATVAESSDPAVRLRWTKAADWEFQLESALPRSELDAFTAGIKLPADPQGTVNDVTFPPPARGSTAVVDSVVPGPVDMRQSLTYARSYGSVPSLELRVTDAGPVVYDVAHLKLTRINGQQAYLTALRDVNGNLVNTVQWHTGSGEVALNGTGLSEAEVLKAAKSVKGVGSARWRAITGGARQPSAFGGSLMTRMFLSGTTPAGQDIQQLATIDRPEATYTLSQGLLTDDTDVKWLCVVLGRPTSPNGSSGDGDCTDPKTGFTTPYLSSSFGQPHPFFVSYPSIVTTVDLRLPDGTTVHTQAAPKLVRNGPRTFYAILDPSINAATITARNSSGKVIERAAVGR